jgi:phage terminase large subunit-like protein
MLRIMSEEDRLVLDDDIRWYSLTQLEQNKNRYNYYITTDFATSKEQSADFSVLSVWALNCHGHWFWVDGVCKRQLMDANIDDLFRLSQKWKPQSVGVEVSGQQGGFIEWITGQMMERNIWFNLASDNNGTKLGIRPVTNKLQRFNLITPWFKAGRMHFPSELRDGAPMVECMEELRLASPSGFRSKKDDFIDTISQLAALTVWKPSEEIAYVERDGVWEQEELEDEYDALESYIV